MKLSARLKTLKALQRRLAQLQSTTLAALPKEYGFRSMKEFIAAIQHATRITRATARRRNWVRPGSTVQLRQEVAHMLAQRKSAVEIALKLGLSMQVVDRVMTAIESRKIGRVSAAPKRKQSEKSRTSARGKVAR